MIKLLTLSFLFCISLMSSAQVKKNLPPDRAMKIANKPALKITIKGVPIGEQQSLNGIYQPNLLGEIILPLLKQKIVTKGLTDAQIARKIEQSYIKNAIYVTPKITVQSIQKNQIRAEAEIQGFIQVEGVIAKPKQIKFKKGITLQQVLKAVGIEQPNNLQVQLTRNGRIYRYKVNKNTLKLKLYVNDLVELE